MLYHLTPNAQWTPGCSHPEVTAEVAVCHDKLCVTFDVRENPEHFRCECNQDGDPCWQDSCVEVFLNAETGYYNFEFNSAGCCLAEHGLSRTPRRRFDMAQYAQIERLVLLAPEIMHDGRIHWRLQVGIPLKCLNLPDDAPISGNLYKCASSAESPNYLCAFPIDTPAPDFHRPEFFHILTIPRKS